MKPAGSSQSRWFNGTVCGNKEVADRDEVKDWNRALSPAGRVPATDKSSGPLGLQNASGQGVFMRWECDAGLDVEPSGSRFHYLKSRNESG